METGHGTVRVHKSNLPIREREVIRMRLIYDVSIEDIAFEKKTTPQEVQKIFKRGLHLLREALLSVENFEDEEAA